MASPAMRPLTVEPSTILEELVAHGRGEPRGQAVEDPEDAAENQSEKWLAHRSTALHLSIQRESETL